MARASNNSGTRDASSALESLNLDELQQFLNTVKASNSSQQLSNEQRSTGSLRRHPPLTTSVPSSPNTSGTLERPVAVRSAANIAVSTASSRSRNSPAPHAGSEPPTSTGTGGTSSSTLRKQHSSIDSLDPNHSTGSAASSAKASVESLEGRADAIAIAKLPPTHYQACAHSEDSGELLGSTGSSGTHSSPAPAPMSALPPAHPAQVLTKDSASSSLTNRQNLRLELCPAAPVGARTPSPARHHNSASPSSACSSLGAPRSAATGLSLASETSTFAFASAHPVQPQLPLSSSPAQLHSRLQVFAFASDDPSSETAPKSPEPPHTLPKHLVCTSGLSMRHATLFKQTAYSHLSKLVKKFILEEEHIARTPSNTHKSAGTPGTQSAAGQLGAASGDAKRSLQRGREWVFEQLAFAQLSAQSIESSPTAARNAPSAPTLTPLTVSSEFSPLQSPDSGASTSFTARSGSISSPTRTPGRNVKRAPAKGSQSGIFGAPLAPLLCAQLVSPHVSSEPNGPLPNAISLILRQILRLLQHAADSANNKLELCAFRFQLIYKYSSAIYIFN